jgi:hypothetical protein
VKEAYEQEDLGVDDRAVFKEAVGRYGVRLWNRDIRLTLGTSVEVGGEYSWFKKVQ